MTSGAHTLLRVISDQISSSQILIIYSWKMVRLRKFSLMALCGYPSLYGQQFRRIFQRILCVYPVVSSVNSKKTTLLMVFYRSRYNLFSLNIPLNTQETSQRL